MWKKENCERDKQQQAQPGESAWCLHGTPL